MSYNQLRKRYRVQFNEEAKARTGSTQREEELRREEVRRANIARDDTTAERLGAFAGKQGGQFHRVILSDGRSAFFIFPQCDTEDDKRRMGLYIDQALRMVEMMREQNELEEELRGKNAPPSPEPAEDIEVVE